MEPLQVRGEKTGWNQSREHRENNWMTLRAISPSGLANGIYKGTMTSEWLVGKGMGGVRGVDCLGGARGLECE